MVVAQTASRAAVTTGWATRAIAQQVVSRTLDMRKHGSGGSGAGSSGDGTDGGIDGGSGGVSGDGRISARTLAETAAANGRRSASKAQDTTLAAVRKTRGKQPSEEKAPFSD